MTDKPFLPFNRGSAMHQDRLDITLADAVTVASVILPTDDARIPARLRGEPGVLISFGFGLVAQRPVVFTGTDTDLDRLAELVRDAVDFAKEKRGWEPPAPKDVRCPGCNAKLHGAVAERGGCFGCYPELPTEEPAKWPINTGPTF